MGTKDKNRKKYEASEIPITQVERKAKGQYYNKSSFC